MHLSKVIDISKSSLIGLKAELLKKQEEVKKIKESGLQNDYVKPVLKQKKKLKSNEGVESRNLKDIECLEDDYDVLKKSREVLEAKSKLYEKLKENNVDPNSQYLIDFNLKNELYQLQEETGKKDEESNQLSADEESYHSEPDLDPEDDWVDFMDTLGRSRRCLRRDLPEMQAKDTKLATSLRPPSPPPKLEVAPELLSWDMQREMMRKKWEEQETLLLGKKDIHYQDILFDEARHHGVGYFEFSMDESERIRQQDALKNLRNETMEQQKASVGLRVRRQQQLQTRLAAARRRRRERLGLPPDEPEPQEAEISIPDNELEQKIEKVEDLEESIKRIAPVRPWDIGKQGASSVMSQEEWVDKKRQERPEEFAPPTSLSETTSESDKPYGMRMKTNFFTSKKTKHKPKLDSIENEDIGPVLQDSQNKSAVRNMEALVEPVCSEPSTFNHWKRTSEQIDDLLSNSKKKYFSSLTVENHDQSSCLYDPVQESLNEEQEIGPNLEEWKSNSDQKSVTKSDSNIWSFGSEKYIEEVAENMQNQKYNRETCQRLTKPGKISNFSNTSKIESISNLVGEDVKASNTPFAESSVKPDKKPSKRKWTEIAPPSSMSYYVDETARRIPKPTDKRQMADSISVGLDYLKARTQEKDHKRVKGFLF